MNTIIWYSVKASRLGERWKFLIMNLACQWLLFSSPQFTTMTWVYCVHNNDIPNIWVYWVHYTYNDIAYMGVLSSPCMAFTWYLGLPSSQILFHDSLCIHVMYMSDYMVYKSHWKELLQNSTSMKTSATYNYSWINSMTQTSLHTCTLVCLCHVLCT